MGISTPTRTHTREKTVPVTTGTGFGRCGYGYLSHHVTSIQPHITTIPNHTTTRIRRNTSTENNDNKDWGVGHCPIPIT